MNAWEYMVIELQAGGWFTTEGKVDIDEFSDILNSYGAVGWELASTFDTNSSSGGTRNVIVVLKRVKGGA